MSRSAKSLDVYNVIVVVVIDVRTLGIVNKIGGF